MATTQKPVGVALLPLDDLAVRRWRGEDTFRTLSYYFSIRWDWRNGVGGYIRHVLGGFGVPPDPREERNPPTPGFPPRYSLVDAGRGEERRYRLYYADGRLFASDSASEVLTHLFWHVNSETIRRTGDFVMFHAGAVTTPAGKGVILPASSGSGKTTLVAGLIRAGFGYLSDEAAAVDPISRRVYAYPKALTFKKPPGDLLPGVREPARRYTDEQWHLTSDDLRPGSVVRTTTLRWIVAPRYEQGAPTTLTPVPPGRAAMLLGQNLMNLTFYGSRALPLLAQLAREAPAYELVSGSLQDAVAAVTDLTR